MANVGNWTYNKYEDGNWCEDDFATKEEAIKNGIEFAKEEEIREFYVAQIAEIPVMASFCMDDILNRVSENMDENYGWEDGEPGERFYENLSNEDIDVLEEMLEKTFDKWVKDRNIKCPCYTLSKVEKVIIPEKAGGLTHASKIKRD